MTFVTVEIEPSNCDCAECVQALLQEEDTDGYYEDSEADTEDDSAEESECAVCNLMFVGETRLEQHCRVAHHWG